LEYAKQVGAKCASIAITYNSEVAKYADHAIEVEVGPEVVTGSTRMKAGTAQKMILNMISTGTMILNGKVYQNLMVDVQQTNLKLVQRAKNIVMQATNCDYDTAQEALTKANGHAKTAIVMILTNSNVEDATKQLKEVDGFINRLV
jgi:N-acetylmuramic acid 6-phosphate etherase